MLVSFLGAVVVPLLLSCRNYSLFPYNWNAPSSGVEDRSCGVSPFSALVCCCLESPIYWLRQRNNTTQTWSLPLFWLSLAVLLSPRGETPEPKTVGCSLHRLFGSEILFVLPTRTKPSLPTLKQHRSLLFPAVPFLVTLEARSLLHPYLR